MEKSDFLFRTLLANSKYQVKNEMIQRFLSDPDNLVLSFTNTLDHFNIEHITASVPKTALAQLPKHFISQVSNDKTDHIVLVSKQANNKVKMHLSEVKSITLLESEFLNNWKGFVIAIEENKTHSKSVFYKENIIKVCLLLSSLSLLAYVQMLTYSILSSMYFIFCLCGLGLNYLIIKEKIGQQTFASIYCSWQQGKKTTTVKKG